MASDAYLRLSKLLLQQSDRHPIRTLSGEALDGFGADVVRDFEQLGLLVRERDIRDVDGVVFHVDDGRARAASFESGDSEEASPLALAVYRIEFAEIARLLRNRLGLEGPAVRVLSQRTLLLGVRGGGRRRQEYYLTRCLRPDHALETLFAIRAHAGTEASVTVLTPTAQDLPRSVMRQVEDLQIFAVSSLLKRQPVAFAISLPPAKREVPVREEDQPRLFIDRDGHVAQVDRAEVPLPAREFGVLILLANEACTGGGFVPRDRVGEAIRAVTGRNSNDEQIDKAIHKLRDALKNLGPHGRIETRRNFGYRLALPPASIAFA